MNWVIAHYTRLTKLEPSYTSNTTLHPEIPSVSAKEAGSDLNIIRVQIKASILFEKNF